MNLKVNDLTWHFSVQNVNLSTSFQVFSLKQLKLKPSLGDFNAIQTENGLSLFYSLTTPQQDDRLRINNTAFNEFINRLISK